MPRNSSAARMVLARPRVDMISSPVAMNVGHMLGRQLEAGAAAVALFQIGGERAVPGGKRQHRFKRQFQGIAGAQPQMLVNFIAAVGNDFARIEQIKRVEALLDLPHELVNFFAHLRLEIFGARNADAVFAAQRSFELQHQRGHLVGNLPVFFQIAPRGANPAPAARAAVPPRRGRNRRLSSPSRFISFCISAA